MFATALGVLEAIARLGDQATIGNINKMMPHLTRGQVDRCIKNLFTEHYVEFDTVPYGRTGKRIWKNTNTSYTNMCIVANAICQRSEAA